MSNSDLFRGNNEALIRSIQALLALDAKGVLAPHGIGEMARDLLETCAARLPAQHQGEPVAYLITPPGCSPALVFARDIGQPSKYANPLYTHPAPAEQQEPYAWHVESPADLEFFEGIAHTKEQADKYVAMGWSSTPVFRHAAPGEVERLTREAKAMGENIAKLSRLLTMATKPPFQCYYCRYGVKVREGCKCEVCGRESSTPIYEPLGPVAEVATLRAQLAEAHALLREVADSPIKDHIRRKVEAALSASVEPNAPKCETCSDHGIVGNILNAEPCPDCSYSAPVERDERADFEALHDKTWPRSEFLHLSHHEYGKKLRWEGWQARAALERKPSDDIPDFTPGNGNKAERRATALLAQLQSDLTARDEELDGVRIDAGRYRWLRSRDLDAISKGGVFAGMTPDNLVLNEDTLDREIDAAMAKELQP